MKNRNNFALAVLCVFIVGLSCRLFTKLNTDHIESDSAQTAAAAIKNKIGKPFKVAKVSIGVREFKVTVRDPDNPNNLDEYKYDGGFVWGPNPVKISAIRYGDLDKSTFPFEDINFAVIPKLVAKAIKKTGLEGGRVFDLDIARIHTGYFSNPTDDPVWKFEVHGTRESAPVIADIRGKILRMDLSRTSRGRNYTVVTSKELQRAQHAFENALGKEAQIGSVLVYDKKIAITASLKENPKQVNSYIFDMSGLQKEDFGGPPRPQPGFEFSEINLTDTIKFFEKAKTRLDMPDGKLSHIVIQRWPPVVMNHPHQPKVVTQWSVFVKSGDKKGNVEYNNMNGEEISLSKD